MAIGRGGGLAGAVLLGVSLSAMLMGAWGQRGDPGAQSQVRYDLLIRGGQVLDAKIHGNAVEDVAIRDGKIVAVGPHLDAKDAARVVDAAGYYVTPGLIDLHVHVFAGTGERGSYAGDNSVYPDGFTFRAGVTTVVDAGSSGWRNFADFKEHVIDRSKTRVLAELNIVGAGMRGPKYENNLDDMDGEATAKVARANPEVVVGIKSAHFAGPEWKPYEQALKAGTIANVPVMIDFGDRRKERPLYDLLATKLRPGDIYTHCYSGLRGEQDERTGGPSEAMLTGRKRGIYFDVGHGGGSFAWSVAAPMMKAGFEPDSISTDLHADSMNAGMKDLLNVADKFLAMGQTLEQVVAEMTWNPAREIKRPELGNLSVGSEADVVMLSLERGRFGFVDMKGKRLMGTQKLVCQLTVRAGKVVWDLNGISADAYAAGEKAGR